MFREPEQHRLEVSVIMTSQLMMRCPCGNDSATRCKTQGTRDTGQRVRIRNRPPDRARARVGNLVAMAVERVVAVRARHKQACNIQKGQEAVKEQHGDARRT